MQRFTLLVLFVVSLWIGLAAQERGPVPGDHSKVPPARVPALYMSAADIEVGLNKLDPKVVSSYAGGAVAIAPGVNAVVRRRVTGKQYAITHTRELEYMVITKGSGTIVTGGTLIPPTIDSDIYPNPDPNATIRSLSGVKDGLARKVGPGDMVFFPAGSRSTWHVTKEIRKVAVCRHNMPRPLGYALRAWNKAVDILTGFSAGRAAPRPQPAAATDGVRATAA